jgi:hypothetical protein
MYLHVLEIMKAKFLMEQGMKISNEKVNLLTWTADLDWATLAGMSLLSAFDSPSHKQTHQAYYWDEFIEERKLDLKRAELKDSWWTYDEVKKSIARIWVSETEKFDISHVQPKLKCVICCKIFRPEFPAIYEHLRTPGHIERSNTNLYPINIDPSYWWGQPTHDILLKQRNTRLSVDKNGTRSIFWSAKMKKEDWEAADAIEK